MLSLLYQILPLILSPPPQLAHWGTPHSAMMACYQRLCLSANSYQSLLAPISSGLLHPSIFLWGHKTSNCFGRQLPSHDRWPRKQSLYWESTEESFCFFKPYSVGKYCGSCPLIVTPSMTLSCHIMKPWRRRIWDPWRTQTFQAIEGSRQDISFEDAELGVSLDLTL